MELFFNHLKPYLIYDGNISLDCGNTVNLIIGVKYAAIMYILNLNHIQIELGGIYDGICDKASIYFFRNFIDGALMRYNFDDNNNKTYY